MHNVYMPCNTGDFEEGTLGLAVEGLVRLPEEEMDLKAFFAVPAPKIPVAKLRSAIAAEREEER